MSDQLAFGMVRASDPPTSKAAAESMAGEPVGKQQADILRRLERCERGGVTGATAFEIASDFGFGPPMQQSVVAKRCSELRDKGLIYDTGRTRPGRSNRQLIVWARSKGQVNVDTHGRT